MTKPRRAATRAKHLLDSLLRQPPHRHEHTSKTAPKGRAGRKLHYAAVASVVLALAACGGGGGGGSGW